MSLTECLIFSALLFALSLIGISVNRRHLIYLLMSVELMLLAVSTNFIAFAHFAGLLDGQVMVFFILTVAAAEAAIGLAILLAVYRQKRSIDMQEMTELRG